MAEIKTKAEFYGLYNRGLIGNMLRNWSMAEWSRFVDAGKYPVDVIAARCTSTAGAPMRYDLQPDSALEWVHDSCSESGINPADYQFAELAPDHLNTLQGEVMRDTRYVSLHYALDAHKRMRDTLTDPAIARHATGLEALMLLKRYMDPLGWDTLQYLWDRWPDAVVEFCCYPKPVGVLQSNTLFWEARTGY